MTASAYVALAATFAVFALTPGPAVAAIVARAIADGAKPALALNAGVLTGDLLFLGLAAAGMAAAAKSMSEVFTVLRWLGVAYLAWQGILLWRTKPRLVLPADGARHESLPEGIGQKPKRQHANVDRCIQQPGAAQRLLVDDPIAEVNDRAPLQRHA